MHDSFEPENAVACTLGAADLSAQAELWRRLMARAAVGRHETPNGVRIEFRADAGVSDQLGELVATENDCCSWAKWSVDVVADAVVLDVTSTGAGIAALHEMLTRV